MTKAGREERQETLVMASNQRKTRKPRAEKPAVEAAADAAPRTGVTTKTGSQKAPQPVSKPKWVSALPVVRQSETSPRPVAKAARAEAQDEWVKAATSPDSGLDTARPSAVHFAAAPLKVSPRVVAKGQSAEPPKAPQAPVGPEAGGRDKTPPAESRRPPDEPKAVRPSGGTRKAARPGAGQAPAATAPAPAATVGDRRPDRPKATPKRQTVEAPPPAPTNPSVATPVQPDKTPTLTAASPKPAVTETPAAHPQPDVRDKAQVAPTASAPPPPAPAAAPKPTDPFGMGMLGPQYPFPDVQALSRNVAAAIEHGSKAFAAYMRPRETGEIKTTFAEEVGEMVRSLGHVAEYYMADPNRAFEAQKALTTQFINLWAATLQRFQGAVSAPIVEPDRTDKRFSHADWSENPFFDFLKQAYVLTTRWADDLVKHADDMEPHARDKAQFYLKQVSAAFAPSNFIGTNPELIRATLEESGENLVRGLKMLTEDIEAGKGNLRIRQSDAKAFKLGVNLATTPGKVVFRSDLIELLQYEPTTPEVYKRPLLIVPPWINKFYILDLNAEKSFIRWAVSQGLTVFVISWINPDSRHADKGFDAYMREGVLTALDCIEQATGERKATAIGYCVGGTLLAATLGYMAAVGDDRIESATFFATQIDFADPGDLKVFVDAEQLKAVEEQMAERGFLDGSAMANAFNMLRPNDLIWSYYVNNYLKGKEPMPFDLLVWNSDATRMPAANHKFYLRHCYLQNDLSHGRMVLGGERLDLKKVTIPVYELATREDHIAPARSVFTGAKCFGGPVRYVMAGSGHIAGVVNPPAKPKYQFWSDGPPVGQFEDWVAHATITPGSWWPDWASWVTAQSPEKVPARTPGGGKLKPLGDAPGEYVKVKV